MARNQASVAGLALREPLGQGDHADRDRQPGADRRHAAPAPCSRPSGPPRTARSSRRRRRPPGPRRPVRSIRLRQPATDSRASSCGVMICSARPVSSRDPVDERRRRSRRCGRPGWRWRAPGRAAAADFVGADLQRRHGALHGRLGQPAGLAQALAQPDDARIGVDDAEAAARRRGDQQAAIVGAQVERGVEPSDAARRRGVSPCGRSTAMAPPGAGASDMSNRSNFAGASTDRASLQDQP